MNQQQLVPEDRAAQALQDLFGAARVCSASVAEWARRKTRAFQDVYRAIGERTVGESVRSLDETGLFTLLGSGTLIRVISARDMSGRERKIYADKP